MMSLPVAISLLSLVLSVISLAYNVSAAKAKDAIMISSIRNSMRLDAHEVTIKIISLVEKIMNQSHGLAEILAVEQRMRIIQKLQDASLGLANIYIMLKREIKFSSINSGKEAIIEYDKLASEIKEFERIANLASSHFESGDMNKLEIDANGLCARINGK